jgi:Tfp pilus assembly protein FimT
MAGRKRAGGVSLLLELMLGLALTGVIALLALGSFVTVARSQNQSMDLTQANALARQVLEAQRALDYSAVQPVAAQAVTRSVEVHSATVSRTFTYRVDVNQPWAPDAVKNVVVTVQWPFRASDPGGPQHQVRLQTCVGPY